MQSQVPLKNYIYFFVSVIVLIAGYTQLRNYLYPPPPPKERIWAYEKTAPLEQIEAVSRLASSFTGRGLADAVDVAAQYFREPVKPIKVPPQWPYQESPRKEQVAAISRGVLAPLGGPIDAALVAQAFALNERVIARHGDFARPVDEIVVGGAGYAITATLTPKGAGVAELFLNRFDAADWYGLPVMENGKPQPMKLIPRIGVAPPAFAIFHYAKPDDDRPLDTLGRTMWTVDKKDLQNESRQEIVFSTDLPEYGVRLIKTFSLAKNEYHLGLTVKVEKLPGVAGGPFRYQLAGARGLPIEGGWYANTFRNAYVGVVDDRDVIYRITNDAASLDRTQGSDRVRKDNKRIVYAADAIQYFASAIAVDNLGDDGAPLPNDRMNFLEFVRATTEDVPDPKKPYLDDITVRAIPETVDPAVGAEHRYLLYHGPVKIRQLSRFGGAQAVAPALVNRYADALKLSSLTDYGNFGWWTSLIIFFTNIVHGILGFLHAFLPGGIAIICVTFLVRICMFPISRKQAANAQVMQEKMQKVAPEMKTIEAKFKDDFLAKQQAQRELYKKHNIHPAAGLSGCLMLIVQMPIFMGLYFALQESVFFRLEPFIWMPNLAAPDMLFRWGEAIPYLTQPSAQGSMLYLGPYLNILPIIAAALIYVQQKSTMPKEMTEEQRAQFMMMKYMPFLMAFMFYRVPAGLSMYFIATSLWGLAERKLVKKSLEKHAAARAQAAASNSPAKPKAKLPIKQPSKLAMWWEKLLKEASKK